MLSTSSLTSDSSLMTHYVSPSPITCGSSSVRPLLEYASTVWNPHANRDTETIEKVQCQAARFVKHEYRGCTSSQDLVNQLGWDSLESRRLLAQVTLFYKIKHNLVDLGFPPSIQPAPRSSTQHALLQLHQNILAYSYSPFVRTVRVWNKLLSGTVQTKNVESFKSLAMTDIKGMKTGDPSPSKKKKKHYLGV